MIFIPLPYEEGISANCCFPGTLVMTYLDIVLKKNAEMINVVLMTEEK
jgi:hypothetical protein